MKQMIRSLLVLVVFAGLSGVARAGDAVEKLSSVSHFAFGGVGVAGTTSQGELAFREVLRSPSAAKDFRKLLADGNAQAKCYALAGLRAVDRAGRYAAAKPYRKAKSEVATISGCDVGVAPMAAIVKRIEAGDYDRYLGMEEFDPGNKPQDK